MKNPYTVLNINTNADQQTIKKAFRTLAMQYHPDMNNGSKEAERKFIEITEAYNILSDPISKKEVDEILNKDDYTNQSTAFNYNYTYEPKYTAKDIDLIIKLFNQQAATYKQKAFTVLLKGLGWLALGILATCFSYSMAAQAGGTYVVFYGAIIFGGWQAIKAFMAYSKINEAIDDFEKEMWSKI